VPAPHETDMKEILSAVERRRIIVQLLDRYGRVKANQLKDLFGVSVVTIRSDLDALADAKLLVRCHGGGIRPLTVPPGHSLRNRESIHQEEKARIAQAAVGLLKPHDTVILCSGTTSAEVARALRESGPEHLTVITHALNVALELADSPRASVVLVGGILRQVSSALVGPHAEHVMRTLHADHCFLGVVGVDLEAGLTTLDIMEAQLNQLMMRSARQVTVLADSSKLGWRSLAVISDFSRVHRLITDGGAPLDTITKLSTFGLDVLIV
jgi:DeoR family transcriptional regulator, aga operon transcriptional repressor